MLDDCRNIPYCRAVPVDLNMAWNVGGQGYTTPMGDPDYVLDDGVFGGFERGVRDDDMWQ